MPVNRSLLIEQQTVFASNQAELEMFALRLPSAGDTRYRFLQVDQVIRLNFLFGLEVHAAGPSPGIGHSRHKATLASKIKFIFVQINKIMNNPVDIRRIGSLSSLHTYTNPLMDDGGFILTGIVTPRHYGR